MNITGIGTDIVQIQRINDALQKHGVRFAERILHANELSIYNAHRQPVSYLAKRFAAKEAVAKALGTGIGKHTSFTEIETINNELGMPMIQYHGATATFVTSQHITQSFLTLSDERDYAVAYVILVS